ncbi:hypothetical protein BJ684DRAFT_19713 [Piptocephalis cylindrospora]|uniref:Uncharacterized protein n=1 Tax=Piptocephalis cylindrospora TaxID=1907219 RepID=A0A4V1IYA0_9FUNG|nr:hypothetical protein BJ684DRAFT_19713 [Piptocephalis cylindrospora]|eukprot:RKP13829.1 hypothetical protein BJ684DRAFT_19713 [Piptocephalis cylindrospora]
MYYLPRETASDRIRRNTLGLQENDPVDPTNTDLDGYWDVSDEEEEEEEDSLAAQWHEDLRQIQALVSVVLVPFFSRWLGRKFVFWAWHALKSKW